jgi:Leucine-rich repeat (LRR) protein
MAVSWEQLDIGYITSGGNLSRNGLSDVSALVPVLSRLTSLTWLYLGSNGISDVSALSGFTNLRRLDLGNNSISDISPLAGLTNLTVSLTYRHSYQCFPD